MKSKPHKQTVPSKKDPTRSITYRLPTKIVEELETEAMNKNISQNVLVKQILEKYVSWDRFGDKLGMIPIPKGILNSLGMEMNGQDINEIIKAVLPLIKDTVLFMKGKYDLKRCIETLEDYMKASGMKSDHRIEGELHHFIIQHELGMNWSFFTEQLLKEIFNQFLPNKNIKFQTTKNTVIATIPLGSDFSEHDY
ncbi:hypothetical protein [Candidatus Nitrosarchaeum limnium]|jgi:hypothetical protein|uniref:Uncharacterized protein n=1 Tax=Candidatus Nitrosarchaeum limnium BG20 TaxID=859192 RepID=S2E304_9ARCH|nr:hypothetical protein [Candidatus Nitrosarchaeum limnium]EPA05670.1 hypothetical protein BG20_I0305 [Candidatus Nitrosarchaeum limnium BG20]